MVWVYGIGGLLLFSSCNAALTAKKETPPRAIAPAPYVPSAAEQAAAKKQAADDAKFWAAKEARETNAAAAYERKQQQDAAEWQQQQALLNEVRGGAAAEAGNETYPAPGVAVGGYYRGTSTSSGRAKTQQVRGHMRNGKWVKPYTRSSKSR